jgi:DNA adenine methylase
LRRAQVVCCDFREILSAATKGDFVYLDPPYATSDGGFCEYASTPFTSLSLKSLLSELEELDRKGAKFLLSYAFCKEIKPFSEKWKATTIMVKRNISGFSGHRKVAQEVMIKNY